MGILHSYGIKGNTESTENERQGVVTQKEETGRISVKEKSIPLPQTDWEMWHAGYRQDPDIYSAVRIALFCSRSEEEKVGVLHQYKINSSKFLILSLVILIAI